jgi:hypothetical protein
MNAYVSQQLSNQHQAELLREAAQARLARSARSGGAAFSGPVVRHQRIRMVVALSAAAAGILATATAVLGAH